jgi:hypothetical protein
MMFVLYSTNTGLTPYFKEGFMSGVSLCLACFNIETMERVHDHSFGSISKIDHSKGVSMSKLRNLLK